MALVIYDQGYRIQTPVKSMFTPRGVEQMTAAANTAAAGGDKDHEKELVDQMLLRKPGHREKETHERQHLPIAKPEAAVLFKSIHAPISPLH